MTKEKQQSCSKALMPGLLTVAFISALMLSPNFAGAQGYPTKQIEIVVPWGAGTSVDIVARMIANIGLRYLSQPMIVTNKPGATGTIGAADVIASKPDGYKLYTNGHPYFANTIHTQKIPFDPHDLVPLASFVELRQGMAVRGDSPFKTFNDLLTYAKKNPGQLRWAHGGRGIAYHITPMLIFKKEGVSTIDVPYKGGGNEYLPALLGGHVGMASVIYGSVVDQVRAGKVRFLMYYSDHRYQDTPDIPTIAELGYPDAVLPAYQAFFIHKNTPEYIKKILTDAFKKIYDDPAFKTALAKIDVDAKWDGPDVHQRIDKEIGGHRRSYPQGIRHVCGKIATNFGQKTQSVCSSRWLILTGESEADLSQLLKNGLAISRR